MEVGDTCAGKASDFRKLLVNVKCGSCLISYASVVELHIHLLTKHEQGQNYIYRYNHETKTAYPLNPCVDSFVQTEVMVEYDESTTQTDTTTCADFAVSSYTNCSSAYDNNSNILDLKYELPVSQENIYLQSDCIDSSFKIGLITDQTTQRMVTSENGDEYCNVRIECPGVKTEINIDESSIDDNIGRLDETDKKELRLRNKKGTFLWERERCVKNKNKTPVRPEQRSQLLKCKLKRLDKNETKRKGIEIIIKKEQPSNCFARTEILEQNLDSDEQNTFEGDSNIPHSEKHHKLDTNISNVDHIIPNSDEALSSVGKKQKRTYMNTCLACNKKCAELEYHIERYHYHDYPLQCGKCFHPFRNRMLADRHNCSLSAVLYRHQCLQCPDNKSFRFRDNLKTHIEQCHENNMPLSCDKCHIPFISKYEEQEHMAKHIDANHDGSSLICSFCQRHYKNVTEFKKHVKANLKCQLCDALFKCRTVLKRHVIALHGPHTAEDNSVNDTEGIVTEGDGKVCEKCGKTIPQYKLAYHMTYFCSKKIYTCQICSMLFKRKRKLISHLKTHTTKPTSESVICERCGESFAKAKILELHIKYKHSFQKDYKCSMCDKAFVTRSTLDRHEQVHLKIRNFQCDQCEKSFSTNWNLKAHRRQHKVTPLTNARNVEMDLRTM